MSGHTRLSRDAEEDLISLRVWYENESGRDLGLRFLAAARSAIDFITQNPGIGRARDWLIEPSPRLTGIRQWRVDKPFNKTLIFYQVTDDGVLIVRVLRGERDLDALFESM